jgi:hypothetical protein
MSSDSITLTATIVFGLVSIGLWIGVGVKTSRMMSDIVGWTEIRDQVTKVLGSSITATVLLLIVSLIYFLQDQTKSIYVIFIMLGIAACLSYSALAAAAAN